MADVGLMGAAAEIDRGTILSGDRLFTEFKGALTEQFICQQLLSACGLTPYYWKNNKGTAEVDFLVSRAQEVYAIEVKATENVQAKSLRVFHDKYPDIHALRFSLSGYRDEGWMINVPLYAVGDTTLWTSRDAQR